MSSSTSIQVPKDMSCVNAFHALWSHSNHAIYLSFNFADKSQEFNFESLDPQKIVLKSLECGTAEKVAELFQRRVYFNAEGGRLLRTDFSNFPELNVRGFDARYGSGTAEMILTEYNKIDPSLRFDKFDSYKFEVLTKRE